MQNYGRSNTTGFRRFCKTMELQNDPALIEQYKQLHAPGQVWPEITRGMREIGIIDMEIYLAGSRLFMIMDTVPEFEHDRAMTLLASKPRQGEWEAFVSRFQVSDVDSSADEKWILMEKIYQLDE
jgi:L-rhamnose mutarotase